jgi:hypothetical protein
MRKPLQATLNEISVSGGKGPVNGGSAGWFSPDSYRDAARNF